MNLQKFMLRSLNIFLPEDEHPLWRNYCSDVSNEPKWSEKALRLEYQGSQEAYGLWFHLSGKVGLEMVREGKDWPNVLRSLGRHRQLAAFAMANISYARDPMRTYADQMILDHTVKNNPVSPLDFGRTRDFWNTISTPFKGPTGIHYMDKIHHLLEDFHKAFHDEINNLSYAAPIKCQFEFQDREIIVYVPANSKNYTFTIACPVQIEGETVKATHILWNWPPHIPFFSKGCFPMSFTKTHLVNFIHASGKNKALIDREVERLFALLTRENLTPSAFENHLAHFMYLYFQSLPFRRGSAAVGIILLSVFLALHGRSLPAAAPTFRSLDRETMCATEEEFKHGLLIWLNGGPFF